MTTPDERLKSIFGEELKVDGSLEHTSLNLGNVWAQVAKTIHDLTLLMMFLQANHSSLIYRFNTQRITDVSDRLTETAKILDEFIPDVENQTDRKTLK